MKSRSTTTFNLGDISGGSKFAIFGGAALAASLTAMLAVSLSTDSALKTTAAAAQIVAMSASVAANKATATGSVDSRDAQAIASTILSAQGMLAQTSILSRLPVPGAASASNLSGAMATTQSAIDRSSKAAAVAQELQSALFARGHLIQQLMTRLEPLRSSPPVASAFESASRLQGYAYSGFGQEASQRIEYDISNLVYQLRNDIAGTGSKELKAAADEINKVAVPLVAQLNGLRMNPQEQAAAVQGVKQLAAFAGSAAAQASQSRGVVGISIAGIFAAIVGCLAMMIAGALKALKSYGARMHAATKDAQKDEVAMAKLMNDAKAIADGHPGIQPSADADSARPLAEALSRISVQIQMAKHNALQFSDAVAKRAGTTEETAASVSGSVNRVSDILDSLERSLSNGKVNQQWINADLEAVLDGLNRATDGLVTGLRTLQESLDRTDGIRAAVQEGNKRVKHVGEASQAAVMSVEDLSGLCEHVQVLSMNAGLEAERAGHHGGGFRLIANDLRTLAARMDDASRKAVDAIIQVQSNTRGASDSVERASQKVAERMFVDAIACAYVTSARTDLEAVAAATRHIGSASNQESEGLAQRADAVSTCQAVTAALASTIGSIREESLGIERQARALRDSVAQQA